MVPAVFYHFGPFRLDAVQRRLFRGSEPIPLTPKAIDVLLLLVERGQEVIDKDQFFERLWPDIAVAEANLTQQIFTLRKVLGERAADKAFIATVPRRGYRFVADVRIERRSTPLRTPSTDDVVRRLQLVLPEDAPVARLSVPVLALSPDGTDLLYVARTASGTTLFHRALDALDVERLAGTDEASSPVWSPDGRWFCFVAGNVLWRMARGGGAARGLADVGECRGIACLGDRVVYAPGPAEGLWVVPHDGGTPARLTQIDFAGGERTHRWPSAVGSEDLVFTIGSAGIASFDDATIAVLWGRSGACHKNVAVGSDARIMHDGLLTAVRAAAVVAIPVEDGHVNTSVRATRLIENIAIEDTGVAHYTMSREGTLIHLPGTRVSNRKQLVWVRPGRGREPLTLAPAELDEPRISPDGGRLAVGIRESRSDVWIHDFERGGLSRLTHGGDNFAPIWTPDGWSVIYSSNRLGPSSLFRQRSDRWDAELLVQSDCDLVPSSVSHDGNWLLYTEYNPDTGANVWLQHLSTGRSEQVLSTAFNQYAAAWHPSSEWFACCSDETGVAQIYLHELRSRRRRPVSITGGAEPVWSRNGNHLYFRSGAAIARASVSIGAGDPLIGVPEIVVDVAGEAGASTGLPNYDITPAEDMLIVESLPSVQSSTSLVVTLNWTAAATAAMR